MPFRAGYEKDDKVLPSPYKYLFLAPESVVVGSLEHARPGSLIYVPKVIDVVIWLSRGSWPSPGPES